MHTAMKDTGRMITTYTRGKLNNDFFPFLLQASLSRESLINPRPRIHVMLLQIYTTDDRHEYNSLPPDRFRSSSFIDPGFSVFYRSVKLALNAPSTSESPRYSLLAIITTTITPTAPMSASSHNGVILSVRARVARDARAVAGVIVG